MYTLLTNSTVHYTTMSCNLPTNASHLSSYLKKKMHQQQLVARAKSLFSEVEIKTCVAATQGKGFR